MNKFKYIAICVYYILMRIYNGQRLISSNSRVHLHIWDNSSGVEPFHVVGLYYIVFSFYYWKLILNYFVPTLKYFIYMLNRRIIIRIIEFIKNNFLYY